MNTEYSEESDFAAVIYTDQIVDIYLDFKTSILTINSIYRNYKLPGVNEEILKQIVERSLQNGFILLYGKNGDKDNFEVPDFSKVPKLGG